ncbi:hypothetical protein GCM10022207_93350 [Streptomyces lannensis]|uniref:SpdA protein n=2 Tax=Bacteria TaxID=2 RepID=A0ABP7LZX0_9ACTN
MTLTALDGVGKFLPRRSAYGPPMTDQLRDADGNPLCAWCGKGPVPPSRGTKPRAYCSRSCVQRAYEGRKLSELLKERAAIAYTAGKADAQAWAEREASAQSGKSRDVPTDRGKSRDDAGAKSRDFPKPQVNSPAGEAPAVPGPADPAAPEGKKDQKSTLPEAWRAPMPSGPSIRQQRRLLPPPPGKARPKPESS